MSRSASAWTATPKRRDENRRYANGRNSFDAVADGLDLLGSPEFRECYSGILCTIDV